MAWIITRDIIGEKFDSDLVTGEAGPSTIQPATLKLLDAGEGTPFRMLDDDREVYYYGRWIEDWEAEGETGAESEFQPLDNFGAPYAGCTIIQYRNKEGKWEDL